MSPATLFKGRRLNGPPVVQDGEIRRPSLLAADELVVRSPRGVRRLFWWGGGFEERPWGDRP